MTAAVITAPAVVPAATTGTLTHHGLPRLQISPYHARAATAGRANAGQATPVCTPLVPLPAAAANRTATQAASEIRSRAGTARL